MRTIIAGSREITNPDLVVPLIEAAPFEITTVLCGMCRGVDMIGRAWAIAKGIPVEEHPADWHGLGSRAGPARNAKMAHVAQALIVVRYERSRGSASMLSLARSYQLKIYDCILPEPPSP